ncbi:thioredoxin family protein [Limosilactobacillus agrestis]|uniref:Thioredoxin family protein n=1 Tax=Limosilactobacillus agrestis TaxID=2759748 RepID=A0A7W3UFU2_9LACO|nr:thioredoxin family protein [Limosilactobacillus agrestis]MBD5090209.1 thioredoxin family protein [Lactobacillus sp.]MBB1094798.1 thioredoxin family protein [Limosilactobacillus agrestis]MBB1099807.1 thioredoxin family protein [Limosilactobacillus agrestis]MCD7113115.1 thioredoxin family protein [Limosilactobacillus agrestis]MCD7120499.1 thioredoxin family protein [Limosilactobacillus agrestis]
MKRLPQLKEDQLIETIGNGKVVLFFTAGWCPDCRFIKPAMPEIEQDFSDYTFYEVDRDENIDLAAELNVFGIPSFIVYDNGKEIGRFVNKDRKTKQQVEDFLNNLK